jgi:hypothetical protein
MGNPERPHIKNHTAPPMQVFLIRSFSCKRIPLLSEKEFPSCLQLYD